MRYPSSRQKVKSTVLISRIYSIFKPVSTTLSRKGVQNKALRQQKEMIIKGKERSTQLSWQSTMMRKETQKMCSAGMWEFMLIIIFQQSDLIGSGESQCLYTLHCLLDIQIWQERNSAWTKVFLAMPHPEYGVQYSSQYYRKDITAQCSSKGQ